MNNKEYEKGQQLDYRFLDGDRHIKYMAGLNMFVSGTPPNLGQ